MTKFWIWLSGKKSVIIGIAGLILAYLVKENIVSNNLQILLNGILILIAGKASIETRKAFAKRGNSKRN